MGNNMLKITEEKKKKYDSLNTMQDIMKEQKVNSLTKSVKINEKRKIGEQRGKPRLDSYIKMIQLKKPVTKIQTMTVKSLQEEYRFRKSPKKFLSYSDPVLTKRRNLKFIG